MNQLSKIVVGAVTIWIGVYLIVYLIFILSGDDTSLAEEGGHAETFGGFKDKFIFNVLKKRDHGGDLVEVVVGMGCGMSTMVDCCTRT